MDRKTPISIFLCPAAGFLNKHSETGSMGQLSYEFISNLSKASPTTVIEASAMTSVGVGSFEKVRVDVLFKSKRQGSNLLKLRYYILSFLRFRFSNSYRNSTIVHHLLPFAPGLSFNLFFLFKDPAKKYILGPIVGPHTNAVSGRDESTDAPLLTLIGKLASPVLRWLSTRTMRNADIVFFSDQYSYESFKAYLKPNQKTTFLGFGISRDVYKTEEGTDEDINVLFVGRLTERKGCAYLIDAMEIIKKSHPEREIKCIIAGTGPLKSSLEALAAQKGLNAVVSFVGGVASNAEFNSLYNKCSMVCLPVLSDHWMSAKEALSCGKPVIITNIASHPEHVRNGENGFLVPPNDPGAIANAIIKLANDKHLLRKLSRNAHTHARREYSWTSIIDKYLTYISEGG